MMTEKFTRPRLGAAKLFTIGGGDEGLGGPLTPIDEKLWTHYIGFDQCCWSEDNSMPTLATLA
jgi:hypothetical protein